MGKFIYLCILFEVVAFICCSKEEREPVEGKNPILGQNLLHGGSYYVATWGNDENSGTFENPWATWQKAFNEAKAGDTVYFRGGVWYPESSDHGNVTYLPGRNSYNGVIGNPICFFNYPGNHQFLIAQM